MALLGTGDSLRYHVIRALGHLAGRRGGRAAAPALSDLAAARAAGDHRGAHPDRRAGAGRFPARPADGGGRRDPAARRAGVWPTWPIRPTWQTFRRLARDPDWGIRNEAARGAGAPRAPPTAATRCSPWRATSSRWWRAPRGSRSISWPAGPSPRGRCGGRHEPGRAGRVEARHRSHRGAVRAELRRASGGRSCRPGCSPGCARTARLAARRTTTSSATIPTARPSSAGSAAGSPTTRPTSSASPIISSSCTGRLVSERRAELRAAAAPDPVGRLLLGRGGLLARDLAAECRLRADRAGVGDRWLRPQPRPHRPGPRGRVRGRLAPGLRRGCAARATSARRTGAGGCATGTGRGPASSRPTCARPGARSAGPCTT